MRVAITALPFEKPKLAVVANVRENDLAEALTQALVRSQKVINERPMKVIEASRLNLCRSKLLITQ